MSNITSSTVDNFKLKIYQEDQFEFNPREFQNYATMICAHGRYVLGDIQRNSKRGVLEEAASIVLNIDDVEELKDDSILDLLKKKCYVLDLFLHDHSGITISSGRFSCKFDSGQIGIMFIEKNKVENEKEAIEIMNSEIDIYDLYIKGEVYGFELYETFPAIEKDGKIYETDDELIDSCFGFYGTDFDINGLFDKVKENNDCPVKKLIEGLKS